jgi:hypothetical protein
MELVPDNLPEVIQYVDLVRAAAEIFTMLPVALTELVGGSRICFDQHYAAHDRKSLTKKARLQKKLEGDAAKLFFWFGDDDESMAERQWLAGINTFIEKGKRKVTANREFPLPARRQHRMPGKERRSARQGRLMELNRLAYQMQRRSWSRDVLLGIKVAETPWYQWQRFSRPKWFGWCGCFG